MAAAPKSVREYLESLPADRRKIVEAVRKTIRANLDPALEEGIQYGMIGYYVPHSVYPEGYHCDPKQPLPFASIGNQKGHVGIYLFCVYMEPGGQEDFAERWRATGKRLDMGKSCVRAKKLEDLALDVLARTIKRAKAKKFIATYEKSREETGSKVARKKPAASKAKKSATRKKAAKKTTKKTTKKATTKTAKKAPSKKKATRKAGR